MVLRESFCNFSMLHLQTFSFCKIKKKTNLKNKFANFFLQYRKYGTLKKCDYIFESFNLLIEALNLKYLTLLLNKYLR